MKYNQHLIWIKINFVNNLLIIIKIVTKILFYENINSKNRVNNGELPMIHSKATKFYKFTVKIHL
jgi:hypothetical protein